MAFDANIKSYLRAYQREFNAAVHGGQHTAELSFRVPMHNMFRQIAHDLNPDVSFDITLEPRNQGRMGRPDWMVQDSVSLGVYGYIEAKGPSSETFDTAPYRNQIARYLSLRHKLIITDGIDYVFCFNETPVVVSLIDKARMGVADWSRLPVNPLFRFYMEQFFTNPAPQRIDEEKLVELVAIRTRNLADDILAHADLSIDEALNDEERQVINLLNGLKALVYNHNDPALRNGSVFADFTAQVVMFCLLYAQRVLCTSSDTPAEKASKIREYAFNDIIDGEALLPFRNLMVYLRDHSGNGTFIGQWVDECIAFLSFVEMTDHQLMNPDYHRLFEDIIRQAKEEVDTDTWTMLCKSYPAETIEAYLIFGKMKELLTKDEEVGKEPEKHSPAQSLKGLVGDVFAMPTTGFADVNTQAGTEEPEQTTSGKHHKHYKRVHSETSDLKKQEIGIVGEACVYKELLNLYPDARWISGNAEKAGKALKGDDTCGYDIKYTDGNGVIQYVEVKASRNDEITFILSDNELRFACKNASCYEVIYVVIGDDGMPAHEPWRLGHLFELAEGEDLLHNDRFSIESDSYSVTAKPIAQKS